MSTIINKLNGLKALLDNRPELDNATAYIASDKVHSYEILLNKPGIAKIAIGFETEEARVNFPGGDITGRVNQTIYAIISRGKGLNQTRSDNLITGSGGGQPLFQLAECMRDKMRLVRFNPNSDEVPDYVSLKDWSEELGIVLDAFICRIWVGTQLSLPVQSNNNPVL